jgi:fructan beta-fructosidase
MAAKVCRTILGCVFVFLASVSAPAADRGDSIVADFEGENYAGWTVAGTAFGDHPARGTLPGQMEVSGYLGRGLVNSFLGGDDSTGTLTSPEFTIERKYLNFLIGGGRHPGKTCIDLLVEGNLVRTASGPNGTPGGSERLEWESWDVGELAGTKARIRIVDQQKGGWGHINIDQIVQSDRKRGLVEMRWQAIANQRYLHLPVRPDAPLVRLKVVVDRQTVREFDIKLADGKPAFQTFLDLAPFSSRMLEIRGRLPADSRALEGIKVAASLPDSAGFYHEPGRPGFHFTSLRGWLNDPNGLVFFDGEYHLYYQHNPYGWDWGNMHWGHAVSRDLVHWTELPIALYPREYGDWAFSGSAVVDHQNTSKFGAGAKPPLVLAYTSTGRGECIAYSNDRGRTWTEFNGNPVVKHAGRDPRLFWHAPTNQWVMAVYDEADGKRWIAFHSSPDMKAWMFESRIEGFFECPEIFELPVRGAAGESRWVVYAADGEYRLGAFDGHKFTPETGKLRLWHGNFYASQTYSDTPDKRRIQIGWGQGISFPGEPFNQQMTVPCVLELRPTGDGIRLFANPVAELESLRRTTHRFNGFGQRACITRLPGVRGDRLEILADAEVGIDSRFTFDIAGTPVVYDGGKKTIACGDLIAPLAPEGQSVKIQVLVDRRSIEIFGNGGRVAISRVFRSSAEKPGDTPIVATIGAGVRFKQLEVHELDSAWPSEVDSAQK